MKILAVAAAGMFFFFSSSFGFGFIVRPLKRLFIKKISYDKRLCSAQPQTIYGHFYTSQIYPQEIQTFYVNERESETPKGIGRDLKPVEMRILKVDPRPIANVDGLVVHKVQACIPNQQILKPSWEEENIPRRAGSGYR
jgi:hypothetical protein